MSDKIVQFNEGVIKCELGEVTLTMPKLKGITFETAIIERYRRRGRDERG
jgi:transposase-like protein